MRRLARAGGHPLPAHVAPASFVYRGTFGTAAASGRDWTRVRTFAIVFGVLFVLARLAYEALVGRRRDETNIRLTPSDPGTRVAPV